MEDISVTTNPVNTWSTPIW